MKKIFLLSVLVSIFAFAGSIEPIQEIFEPQGDFSEQTHWKVAVIQWNPTSSADVTWSPQQAEEYKMQNRKDMEERIRIAANNGAKYISLSEFAVTGYPDIPELRSEEDNFRSREDIQSLVETVPGPSTQYFSLLAQQLGVWIQFGLAEVDEETNNYHNSAVVINDHGQIAAVYRKQHLFQIEDKYLVPGNENVTFDTPAGKFGLIICSDSYDYKVLELYKKAQVDVLSLSTSWAQYNTGMGYFKRAAQRAQSYLLAANQTYFPDSGVINKDGSVQSHIRQSDDAIAYGYLPLK